MPLRTSSKPSPSDAPLRPVEFFLLSALDGTSRHGYGLVETIEEITAGRFKPRPGDLYRVLHRLERRGLVAVDDDAPAPDDDERRTYYRLTRDGAATLRAEAEVLARVAGGVLRRTEAEST